MAEASLKIAVNTQEVEKAIVAMDKFDGVNKSAIKAMRDMEYKMMDVGRSISNVEKVTRQITDTTGKYFNATQEVKDGLIAQARELDAVAKATGRATNAANDSNKSYKGVGGSIRNVSYQVQDFATQVGAGTSASTALGQQLPQLLSGFGLMGVVLGTVTAVIIPLVNSLGLFDTKAEKASKALEKFSKELSATAEMGGEVSKFVKDFTQSSADGFVDYVKAYNKASAEQRKEMDLWLQKKLIVEQAKLADIASEAQGRNINFGAGQAGGETTNGMQFDPNLERQVELAQLYRVQADNVKRLTAAVNGDMATATAGAKATQNATIAIQQKIDAVRAEAQYIGISNAEKEKAIALAQFEAEAKRSGIGVDRAKIAELNREIDLKHKALETAEIEKYSIAQQTANDILREQGNVININSRENQKFIEQEKLKGFIAQQTIGWNTQEKETFREKAQNYLAEKQALDDIQYAKQRTFGGGATAALIKYGEDAANVGTQVGNAFTNAFKGMEDAIVQFTMTGKASFSSFALSVISDIQRILVRQALLAPIASGIGSLFGTSTIPPVKLATGTNYVPYDGMPAILHKGEAVIPARYNPANGGSGLGSSSVNNVVTVNVSMANGGSDSSTSNGQDATKLGTLISNAVKSAIIKEQRNGGLLSGA